MTDPRLTPLIAALPATVPFIGPEQIARERGRPFHARLGANELGFGPSPRAIKAMRRAADTVWTYCDPTAHELSQALADHLGIPSQNLVIGEGVDGLLGVLVRLTIAPGDRVVTTQGTYPTFNYHVAGCGGTLHSVPYRDDRTDLQALAEAAHSTGAKLVYLANPDNPMGGYWPADQIQSLLRALPSHSLLVLDEAYIEFAPEAMGCDIDDTRLIRMRSFSKAYGLAGARIGYAFGARALIAAFDRIRNHFGVNAIAQAGALAALQDQDHLTKTRQHVARAKDRLARIAQENGLIALPSATNFVTMDAGQDGAFATAIMQELTARDVFIRMPFVAPQNRCLRISAGPDHDLDLLEHTLPDAIRAARG